MAAQKSKDHRLRQGQFIRNSNEIRTRTARATLRVQSRSKGFTLAQEAEPSAARAQSLANPKEVTPDPLCPLHTDPSLDNPRALTLLLLSAAKVNPGMARNTAHCLEGLVTTLPDEISLPKNCFSRRISQKAKSVLFFSFTLFLFNTWSGLKNVVFFILLIVFGKQL